MGRNGVWHLRVNKLYQLIAHYEQSERDLSALNDSPIYSLYQDKAQICGWEPISEE